MHSKETGPTVGFDVGGTGVKYGLVDPNGEPLTRGPNVLQMPSRVKDGPDTTLRQIGAALSDLKMRFSLSNDGIAAAGLAVAGPATLDGVMHFSANFGDLWRGARIRQRAETQLGIPVSYENDANAAGLGERARLIRKSPKYANNPGILLTVGTGLGAAFFGQTGELLRGATGGGGEFGHSPMPFGNARSSVNLFDPNIKCPCGRCGCAELFISRAFLEREVTSRKAEDPTNAVYESQNQATWVDAVPLEAANGNQFALSILKDQAYNLGLFIGRQVFVLDPRWVIIGGGISSAPKDVKKAYLEEVVEGIRQDVNPYQFTRVKVLFAGLGNSAGWIGATISAREMLERGK